MRVAVKNCKEPNDHRREPERRMQLSEDHRTQHERRNRDANLYTGKRDTEQPQQTTNSHHHGKRDRQHPDRRGAEHGAPEPHGNHCEYVIEPRNRVLKSGEKASDLTGFLVRQRDGWHEREQHCTQRCIPLPSLHVRFHVNPLNKMATRWIVQNAPSVPTR